jgi:benzoyl-CoA-dihydrodiol lyase
MARELDDAILHLRTNEIELGIWVLKTTGNREHVLACDSSMEAHASHWLVRETIGMLRRTFARIDVSSRSLFALVDQGSCFAGTLAELAFAADRSYMLSLPDAPQDAPSLTLSAMNFGVLPMITGQTRLARRFYDDDGKLKQLEAVVGESIDADKAMDLGLITANPDDIDWDDEIRLVLEERASMSPDALTGMEANLRFNGQENMATRVFGRLSAWQNWIFNRPNAVGESGALKVYGTGSKAKFEFDRV